MSQPVKLSDALVLDARTAGEAQERSIARQVEFWARLGRSVELLLDGQRVLALRRSAEAQPLSEALAAVDTAAGRKRVADVLAGKPFPHFKPVPGEPGLLLRTDADGTETMGRFVHRVFEPMAVKRNTRRKSNPAAAVKAPVRIKAKPKLRGKEREAWA